MPNSMSEPNRSESDSSKTAPTAAGVLRAQPDYGGLETDFADLAARFAAHSGGGLSAELSADLALEIVLNEIVEQACLATGATGAAVVLPRDGEMMCRASSGHTAPELGARLDTASGLSGECVKTHRTQRCDDVLVDPKADSEASRRLGVRSVMVMPLLRGDELVGVIELFSSRAYAFGDRDEGTLEALAARILSNLDCAAKASELPSELPSENPPIEDIQKEEPSTAEPVMASAPETAPAAEPLPEIASEISDPDQNVWRRLDVATWVLGVAVVACAVLLGLLIGRHMGAQKVTARARPVVPAASTVLAASAGSVVAGPAANNAPAPQPAAKPKANRALPPGGLRVFENGREVFRLPPAENGVAPDAEPGDDARFFD